MTAITCYFGDAVTVVMASFPFAYYCTAIRTTMIDTHTVPCHTLMETARPLDFPPADLAVPGLGGVPA